jgi:hypothetical protein
MLYVVSLCKIRIVCVLVGRSDNYSHCHKRKKSPIQPSFHTFFHLSLSTASVFYRVALPRNIFESSATKNVLKREYRSRYIQPGEISQNFTHSSELTQSRQQFKDDKPIS